MHYVEKLTADGKYPLIIWPYHAMLGGIGHALVANVEEAVGGISKADFLAKMQIAYKEARESHYWLRLMKDSGILEAENTEKMINACEELIRILCAILKTGKK